MRSKHPHHSWGHYSSMSSEKKVRVWLPNYKLCKDLFGWPCGFCFSFLSLNCPFWSTVFLRFLFYWCSMEFDEPSHVQSCLLHGNTLRDSPSQRLFGPFVPWERSIVITSASKILGPLHSQSEWRPEIGKEAYSTWTETYHLNR